MIFFSIFQVICVEDERIERDSLCDVRELNEASRQSAMTEEKTPRREWDKTKQEIEFKTQHLVNINKPIVAPTKRFRYSVHVW